MGRGGCDPPSSLDPWWGLAGGGRLFERGATAAEAETTQYAEDSHPGLVTNLATIDTAAMTVTSEVGDQPGSFFVGALSLGNPNVLATATARVGAAVLPGPGVFCVGSHVDTVVAANAANAALFAPLDHIWLVPWVLADEYYTVLRFGAGSGSNAGYVDIGDAGGASQAVRTCFEEGSAQGLQPVERTQTGIAAGPVGQGLQARLEAAAANGCASWDAITSTLIAAGGADGLVEGDWVCSPYHTQASAVELLPVMRDPFQDTPRQHEHRRLVRSRRSVRAGLLLAGYRAHLRHLLEKLAMVGPGRADRDLRGLPRAVPDRTHVRRRRIGRHRGVRPRRQ